MADVKMCDRCGKVYELREPAPLECIAAAFVPFTPDRPQALAVDSLNSAVDLCASCETDFRKWWKEGGKAGSKE